LISPRVSQQGYANLRWYDLLDAILTNELRQTANLLQMSLGIRNPHGTVHPIYTVPRLAAQAGFARMVPSVL
jgi:hypothetical protein